MHPVPEMLGAAVPRRWRPIRYLAFARMAVAREVAYRLNVLVALLGFMARVYVLQYVWTHLYRTHAAVAPGGIALPAMLTYMVVGQLSMMVVQADSTMLIREKVREGQIAIDLIRPLRFPIYLLADNVGKALFRALLALPALAFALVAVDLMPPPTLLHAVLFVPSLMLGFLISFLLNFLTNLTAFWTLETFGLQYALRLAGLLLSGAVVPIWFLPAGLARSAHLLPFSAMFGTPLSIFIGRLDASMVWQALALQAGWAAVLGAAAMLLWRQAERHLTVQGG